MEGLAGRISLVLPEGLCPLAADPDRQPMTLIVPGFEDDGSAPPRKVVPGR